VVEGTHHLQLGEQDARRCRSEEEDTFEEEDTCEESWLGTQDARPAAKTLHGTWSTPCFGEEVRFFRANAHFGGLST
jgi:hypothetical protein